MLAQQIKCPPYATKHTKRQYIDLEQAKRIKIILVPFDYRTPLHRGRANRA